MTDQLTDEQCCVLNICPLCRDKPRTGVAARRALQEHLKRPINEAHKLWRAERYHQIFKRGGNTKTQEPITDRTIIQAIERTFGSEWACRISVS